MEKSKNSNQLKNGNTTDVSTGSETIYDDIKHKDGFIEVSRKTDVEYYYLDLDFTNDLLVSAISVNLNTLPSGFMCVINGCVTDGIKTLEVMLRDEFEQLFNKTDSSATDGTCFAKSGPKTISVDLNDYRSDEDKVDTINRLEISFESIDHAVERGACVMTISDAGIVNLMYPDCFNELYKL